MGHSQTVQNIFVLYLCFSPFGQEYPFLKVSEIFLSRPGGWSGGAMVLGKLPVPGRPTIWMIVGQGPTVLAVGAGGVVWTF